MVKMKKQIKLKSQYDYYNMPEEVIKKISNGCGDGSWKNILIPETIYGLNIKECCTVHDIGYYFGISDYGKTSADKIFLENMYTLIKHGTWWLRFLRRRRAIKYYLAVKYFGKKAYMSNKEGINNDIEITDRDLISCRIYQNDEFKYVK